MSTLRFRAMIPLLIAVGLLAGCGSNNSPHQPDLSLQQLQQRGLALGLTASATSAPVGTPVTLSFTVTNNSGQPQTVSLATTHPEAFPPLRFVISASSGSVVQSSSVTTPTTPVTIAPGETVTIATFVWDQTNTAGRQVSAGTYSTFALVGEVIVDGQAIFNPYGTIYVPGPSIRVTAVTTPG